MYVPGYYEIRRKSKTSWTYFYTKNGESREIWGNSVEDLKKRVEKNGLPWNDNKVPDENPRPEYPFEEHVLNGDVYAVKWIESNYKRRTD